MIPAERIDQIVAILSRAGLNDQTVAALRATWPELHWTLCQDDDIGAAKPVRAEPGFRIYLVDGRAHCARLTLDFDAATGIVLAEVDPAAD